MSGRGKAKRSVWALIGKALWLIVKFVLTVLAKLGSHWAKKALDKHHDAGRDSRGKGPLRRVRRRKD